MFNRKNLGIIVAVWVAGFPVAVGAQDEPPVPKLPQNYSEWVNELFQSSLKTEEKKSGFMGPKSPDPPVDPDPDGAIQSPRGPGSSKVQFRRPSPPDFSKLRKKARRVTYQSSSGATEGVDEQSFTSFNIDVAKQRVAQIDGLVGTMPDGEKKYALVMEKSKLVRQIQAATELEKLVGESNEVAAGDPNNPANFSPSRQRRIRDLKSELFVQPTPPATIPTVPNQEKRSTASSPARIPSQFYRPPRMKSLYEEIRENKNLQGQEH